MEMLKGAKLATQEQLDNILTFLGAYPRDAMKAALKEWNARYMAELRGERVHAETEWKEWEGEGTPPRPYEWVQHEGKTFFRNPPERIARSNARAEQTKGERRESRCPFCGDIAFGQGVCAKCAKGKAGIKTQWICGNDPEHVFFTED